jgi:hypothetical protein
MKKALFISVIILLCVAKVLKNSRNSPAFAQKVSLEDYLLAKTFFSNFQINLPIICGDAYND